MLHSTGMMFTGSKKMSQPSDSSSFYFLDDIRFTKWLVEFIIVSNSPSSIITDWAIYFPQDFSLKNCNLVFIIVLMAQVSHPYSSTDVIKVFYNLHVVFLLM
jgi:hypothetical protein